MAKYLFHQLIFLITFLVIISPLTSARDITPRQISLVKEPDQNYYIVKKSPVVIVCQAKNAAEIHFTCMGTQIPPTSVEVTDVSDIDPDLIQSEIEVSLADLQNREGQEPFYCQCSAVDFDGQVAVTSRKGFVTVAYIKNKFESQPASTAALIGDRVELACGAPEGQPKPETMWRKDKKRLEVENNPRMTVIKKGNLDILVIHSVSLADNGQYQCVARNAAGRRESEEAQLVAIDMAESEEPDVEISEDGDTGSKSGFAKPRATRQSVKSYFTSEPQEKYYVTRDKPVVLDCGVVAADIMTFRCNGQRMNKERQTINQGLDAQGNRIIQSQVTITYDEVQTFLSGIGDRQPYQCICAAWYYTPSTVNKWGNLESSATNGYIYLAYLDPIFQAEPSDVVAGLNTDATLICESPKGEPNPWIYWLKDNNRVDARTTKHSMSPKGHLTIHNVQYEDAGVYYCMAENVVNSVQSRPARLTVTDSLPPTTTASPAEGGVPTFPSVIPSSPVFIIDFEEEINLGADGTATVACAVVSAEQMTVECGGRRLPPNEYELKNEVHTESGKRLLFAKAVITAEQIESSPEDFFCQCTAWFLNEKNTWGQISSSKGYIRQASEGAFIEDEFVIAPEDTDAHFEYDATLECEPPRANPPAQVYWLKDGVRIDSDADPNFVILGNGKLIIEYVRVTDEGQYTCVAENEAGRRESQPAQLTVLGKPTVPTQAVTAEESEIETTPSETIPEEEESTLTEEEGPFIYQDLHTEYYIASDSADGEEVTLVCAVTETKHLLFVCNNETLQETLRTGQTFTDPNIMKLVRDNSLVITRQMVEDYAGPGPYTCFCRAFYQKEGAAQGQFTTLETSQAVIKIAYLDEDFVQNPSDTQVTNLGRAELLCKPPAGEPVPKISWLKDGAPVASSERIRVENSGSLIIEPFEVDDEGSYVCVANNSFFTRSSQPVFLSLVVTAGIIETVTTPYVRSDLQTAAPEPEVVPSGSGNLYAGNSYISKDLHSSYYVVKNKPVTITCEAYNVEFITFTCGTTPVQVQEDRKREEELSLPNGEIVLVPVVEASINVSKEDVENYGSEAYPCQCFAHYSVPGAAEHQKLTSAVGRVEITYLKKNFQEEPEDQSVAEGSTLTLHCQPPVGNPPAEVSWTRNGEEVQDGLGPEGVLIIPGVQQEHAGEYVCIAENEAGKRMSSPARVEVTAGSQSSTASRGETSCPKLQECESITSNALEGTNDASGVSLRNLCGDTGSILECVDAGLVHCNVTRTHVEEREGPETVKSWVQHFCLLVEENSGSCEEINRCNLNFGQVTAAYSSYWCSQMYSVKECTQSAAISCNLDDLDEKLEDMYFQKYCANAGVTKSDPWPEVKPEPEGDSKFSAEVVPEPSAQPEEPTDEVDEDGDKDGDDENREADAEASQNDPESRTAVLETSLLLVTVLQLLTMACLSWR